MPSPIAHSALVMLSRPCLGVGGEGALTRRQRVTCAVLIVTALCSPDIDLALSVWLEHGTVTHSLPAMILFTSVFAPLARWWVGSVVRWHRWCLLIGGAYATHLLMDVFTAGRGVMVGWPIWQERVVSPWPIFFGAHHSDPMAWHLHAITLGTELGFALALWLLSRWALRRTHPPLDPIGKVDS